MNTHSLPPPRTAKGDGMTAKYVPQVGDPVHLLGRTQRYRVTAVGEQGLLAVSDGRTSEVRLDLGHNFVKCEPPPPIADVWYYITAGGIASLFSYDSRWAALDSALGNAMAILHTWTDADGVDHAEIERVTA